MWQKCKRPSRRLRDSWRGFVCKTRVYEGRVFFAMKLSPKVFNTFRRFRPFSPIFHVHRCLKKISMFDALFTFVEITSYCWYVLAWKKTLLGKGGKNVGTLRSWITELQTPGCRIPTATDFGPKCCALDLMDLGHRGEKTEILGKLANQQISCCGRLRNFKYF